MKKLLAAIVVVAMCAPAMAVVTVTTDGASITLTADGTETTELVGVALTVNATAPVTGVIIDDGAVDSFFDIFVDSAFTAGAGYNLGDGIPTAIQDGPGELALPASVFSVSIAGLDDDGIGMGTDEAPLSVKITFEGTGGTEVTVGADTLRGTAVSYAGAAAVETLPVVLTLPSDECYAGQPDYAVWAAVGKPLCWCGPAQCHGDANGQIELGDPKAGIPDHRVGAPDLTILANGWQKPDGDVDFATFICADFNHTLELGDPKAGIPDHRVGAPDLSILAAEWQSATTAEDCLQ